MKKNLLIAALMILVLASCVRVNPHCKQAHKNIKKLHLQAW
ncbi:MAG: hypothetical protein ACJ75J_04010 [Cytophagaceae bacterium]